MSLPSTPRPRRLVFAFFLLFLIAYNLFRVALFVMTQNGAVKPDRPLDPLVNSVIVYSELVIGVVGLLAIPGIVWAKPWGFWLTVAVSAFAIVFDAWSAVVVQPSAAGGVAPPLLVLLFLALYRSRFLRREAIPATVPAPSG